MFLFLLLSNTATTLQARLTGLSHKLGLYIDDVATANILYKPVQTKLLRSVALARERLSQQNGYTADEVGRILHFLDVMEAATNGEKTVVEEEAMSL